MTLPSHFRRAVSSASLLAALGLALPAHAQGDSADGGAATTDVEQARKHFSQGLKLYKDGDFDAALIQFERAYAVKPNFKVLYNIAQCHFELHQYVEARDKLSQYLKEGDATIEAERKTQVESDLRDLQHRIAHLKLSVNVDGATVYIDGKKAGVTPLSGAVDVSEGQRTVSVETAERGSKQRVVQLAGGDEQVVSIEFEAASSAAPLQPSHAEPTRVAPAQSSGLGAGFWVTGIGALALGAGAGVTGYLALQAQHDHEDQVQRFGATEKELNDSHDRAKTFALTTDILAGTAIVCAGIATVLLITHDSGPEQVGLGIGPGSVAVRGRF
jgi:hypothetical protein